MSAESEELARLRRDLEAQEAFKADLSPWKRRYVPPVSSRIRDEDPRERD